MAYPTISATASNLSTVGAADQTLALPTGSLQPGDLGMIFLDSRKPWASTIGEPSGWTQVVSQTHTGSASTVAVYSRVYQSGDPNPVFTFTDTTQRQVLVGVWLNNAAGIGVVGSVTQEDTSDTTSQSPSLTTSSTENLIIDFHAARNDPTNPPTSGSASPDSAQDVFSIVSSGSQPDVWVGHFQKAAAGTTNAQTLTTNQPRVAKWSQQFAIIPVLPQQVWRPVADGDGTVANWTKTPSGALTRAACVNDDDPTTFIQSADNPSGQVYSTETFTLSVPSDLSTLRVEIKGYRSSGSSGQYTIALLQGTTVVKSTTVNPVDTSESASTLSLTQAEAETLTVTGGQWQNLRVRVTATAAA